MHLRPYRNDQIVGVIWDLYFTRGHTSFALHFDHLFPSCGSCDNVDRQEVPDAMVALAATAVRQGTPRTVNPKLGNPKDFLLK